MDGGGILKEQATGFITVNQAAYRGARLSLGELEDHDHKITSTKLLAAIPPILVGALVFIIVISSFELIRLIYDDTFLKEDYKDTLDRLPLYGFVVLFCLLLLYLIIKFFD